MRIILFLSIVLLFSSCKSEQEQASVVGDTEGFSLIQQEFKKAKNCADSNETCYNVVLKYARATGKDSLSLAINEYLIDYLDDFLATEEMIEEQDVDNYISEMLDANAMAYVEDDGRFELDIDVITELSNNGITCLRSSYYQYSGGAHGNSGVGYHIFNNQTGELLSNDDIIDNDVEFKALLISSIKAMHNDDDSDLEDIGYFVTDSEFEINDNIGVSSDSLFISYVPYEIAPYSAGFTNLAFSHEEIKNLLKATFVEKWMSEE